LGEEHGPADVTTRPLYLMDTHALYWRRLGSPKLSRTKVEKADIETVVGEFRKFLETALEGEARAERTIVVIR
jgi:hypothetical protein